MARRHSRHGHDLAEQAHLDAAEAHEAAMATPLDERLAGASTAMSPEGYRKLSGPTCYRAKGQNSGAGKSAMSDNTETPGKTMADQMQTATQRGMQTAQDVGRRA